MKLASQLALSLALLPFVCGVSGGAQDPDAQTKGDPAVNAQSAKPTGSLTKMSLSEAVHLAIQKNEDLQIERESLGAAKASLTGARGAYDPVLGLDGGWQRSTEPFNSPFAGSSIGPAFESTEAGLGLKQLLPTGGELSLRARGSRETDEGLVLLSPAYRTRAGVELRQPLLRDRATDEARRNVRVAQAGREGAVASLRRAVSETVAAVERAYWALVQARLGVGVREEAVRLAEEQLTETQHRVDAGSVPQTELAQPRAELERRRGELLASREVLARTENDLKILILAGADDPLWSSEIAPTEETSVEITAVDVAALTEGALTNRPELAVAAAVVKRRRAETAFARDRIWPALDAVASYDRFGLAGSPGPSATDPVDPDLIGTYGESLESLRDGEFHAARVALELELPILNRTARGNAAAARHTERQAEAELARIRKTVRAEVLDAATALETAGQRVEAARAGREAAEIQLSAERDRYATGLSTNFLVLTRQNDLSRARLDEISALTDYRTARTEMARATGRLIDEHGIDRNEWNR
jgi:outer membrane protein TolC